MGATATSAGVAIPGISATNYTASGSPTAVVMGSQATEAGAFCANCTLVTSGGGAATAAGVFYPVPNGTMPTSTTVAVGTVPTSDGMFCPGGSGTFAASTSSGTVTSGGTTSGGNSSNTTLNTTVGPTKASTSGIDLQHSLSSLAVLSAIAIMLQM